MYFHLTSYFHHSGFSLSHTNTKIYLETDHILLQVQRPCYYCMHPNFLCTLQAPHTRINHVCGVCAAHLDKLQITSLVILSEVNFVRLKLITHDRPIACIPIMYLECTAHADKLQIPSLAIQRSEVYFVCQTDVNNKRCRKFIPLPRHFSFSTLPWLISPHSRRPRMSLAAPAWPLQKLQHQWLDWFYVLREVSIFCLPF